MSDIDIVSNHASRIKSNQTKSATCIEPLNLDPVGVRESNIDQERAARLGYEWNIYGGVGFLLLLF